MGQCLFQLRYCQTTVAAHLGLWLDFSFRVLGREQSLCEKFSHIRGGNADDIISK